MAFLPYLILIISSLRGLFLLGFSLPPTPYIFFSFTIVGIVLVVLSSKIFFFMQTPGPLHGYLKLFLINVIIGIVWCFGEIIIAGFNLESLRAFLFYFIILYLLIKPSFKQIDSQGILNLCAHFCIILGIGWLLLYVLLFIFLSDYFSCFHLISIRTTESWLGYSLKSLPKQ